MNKVTVLLCTLLAALLVPQPAAAEAVLWLFPHSSAQLATTDAYYADLDYNNRQDPLEPMLTESYVKIGPGGQLDIYNHGKAWSHSTVLVVSVNDVTLLSSITLGGTAYDPTHFAHGTPLYHSGRPMPPHGVFATHYMTWPVGAIAPGAMAQISYSVAGTVGLKVHFDAYGQAMRGKKKRDLTNPFSHDVTWIHYGHDVEFNKGDINDPSSLGG